MPHPASTSETTLVAPIHLTYTLSNDNPSNTSFISGASESVKPAYRVQTEWTGSKTITTILNAEGVNIASLEWRETLPDKVTFMNKSPTSLSNWMRSGLLPNSAISFQDDNGRQYQWKNVAAGLSMELHAKDTPGGAIAAFRKSRVDRISNTLTPATFVMTARAQEISDLCVASFLFLEKKRRMRENSSVNRARALALSGGG